MYQFYIGSNNITHLLELDKIKEIMADYAIAGYTIINAQGFWQGAGEKSIILQVEGLTKAKALTMLEVLKLRLQQAAIGFQRLPEIQFI